MKQFEMTFLLGAGRILLTLTVPLILTHQKIMVASFGCWSWTSFSSFLEIFSKWVEILVWEWSLRCGSLKPSSQLCCLYVSQDVFFIPYMIRRSQLYLLSLVVFSVRLPNFGQSCEQEVTTLLLNMISYQLGRARLPLPLQVKLMDPGENHERDMESRWTNERKAKPSRVASGGYLGLVVVAIWSEWHEHDRSEYRTGLT
jgi:hypothetical protein